MLPPSRARLVQAMEAMFVVHREVGAVARPFAAPGVVGFSTESDHAFFNRVVSDDLAAEQADASIAAAIDRFNGAGKSFSWFVGPTSTPDDLAARLVRAGFESIEEIAGMALLDLTAPIRARTDLAVRRVTLAEIVANAHVLREGFGMPPDVLGLLKTFWANVPPALRRSSYLAFDSDGTAVAQADLMFVPGTSIALFGGAATLPAYRGRGAYTALVEARLRDAVREGAEAIIIQANRRTSAPILTKLGFQEVAAFERFARSPGADRAA